MPRPSCSAPLKSSIDRPLQFARGLQVDLLHRIVGLQLGDVERSALAVILAVELGVVLRALEVGQHVAVRPAAVAERGPVVVVGFVAADIDHRVDGRRAAEPLAARLIADPAVQALLRHGVERPVVDLAGDHQDQRAGRGHDPVVVPAAGLQQRHRGGGVLAQAARHRAAAGTPAHDHEIELIGHDVSPCKIAPSLAGFDRS